ncbi:MAG: LysM peptidoglycan-binding domain-containing protein [Ruminococcaceae bacterium]|nr:LysM peptidoglycan-binding domain-containing protein [Oscillospiraceae bacterium]
MNTIYPGERAYTVYLMKLALSRALGITPDFTDLYDDSFKEAVTTFQEAKELKADGVIGPVTFYNALPYLYGFTLYKTKEGDSFFKLAKMYETSIAAIERANPDISPDNLETGVNLVIPYSFSLVTDKIPYSYELCQYILYGLVARYPFLDIERVGSSVMGKTLYAVKAGRGKREYFYNATHHANEWITTPLLLKFLEEYSKAYAEGGNIGEYGARLLYNSTSLYLVPLVNPDGLDLVTGAADKENEYYKRAVEISKSFPEIPFPTGWKANISGFDLNLNYPAEWEEAKRIKSALGFTRPAPRDFTGYSPLDAPESRAIYDFTLKKNFLLTLSYHTQGEVIYWKFLDYEPEGALKIAREFALLSGYSVEEVPAVSGYAGYKDWFILNYMRPGFTIEAGKGINPLPISALNDIYEKNLGILTYPLAVGELYELASNP